MFSSLLDTRYIYFKIKDHFSQSLQPYITFFSFLPVSFCDPTIIISVFSISIPVLFIQDWEENIVATLLVHPMALINDGSTFSLRTGKWIFDVFLNFRGEDTRHRFLRLLYDALVEKRISTFKDDEVLERGKPIPSELLKAIEGSRFSVVIFSKNYATSSWCLDELTKIVECRQKMKGLAIFPVFFDVEPTEVRKQEGSFREAFAKHEEAFKENLEKVKKWRDALKEVANISGWVIPKG